NFEVLRLTEKKKHPLLKKSVDWDANRLAVGNVQHLSDTQVAGQIRTYRSNQKLMVGDWVKLQPLPEGPIEDPSLGKKKEEEPGRLGILSSALFGTSSSVDPSTPSCSKGINGKLLGLD